MRNSISERLTRWPTSSRNKSLRPPQGKRRLSDRFEFAQFSLTGTWKTPRASTVGEPERRVGKTSKAAVVSSPKGRSVSVQAERLHRFRNFAQRAWLIRVVALNLRQVRGKQLRWNNVRNRREQLVRHSAFLL